MGSCVGIRLSPFHGNVGMFVVKEEYRGCGIGTAIWQRAIKHLGDRRNKGLSAVPKLFHIYVEKAQFNKVASWDVILFKLDGKRLLANLASFLKSRATRKHDHDTIADANQSTNYENRFEDDKSSDRSDDCSISDSTSENGSEADLNSIIENEELNSDSFNHKSSSKNVHSSTGDTYEDHQSNCLKDITNEENIGLNEDAPNADACRETWTRRKKSDLNRLKESKFHTFNQLIYYSSPKAHQTHLNSFSNYSTVVFRNNKPNSPSISLPSLLNSDSFSIFDHNSFRNHQPRLSFENRALFNNRLNNTSSFSNQVADLNNQVDRINVIPYSKCWLDKLTDYDERLHGYNRSKIVRLSVDEENSKTKLAIIGSEIVGYAIVKYSLQDIYLVAPLYCDSQSIANDLIKSFVRSMTIQQLAKGLVLKLPNCNHNAIELMEKLGFEKQDYLVTRCFTDYVHQTDTSKIFAMQSTIFSSE